MQLLRAFPDALGCPRSIDSAMTRAGVALSVGIDRFDDQKLYWQPALGILI